MPKQPVNQISFESMTKAELQAEARARGLPFGGTRAELLKRLQAGSVAPLGEVAPGQGTRGGEGGGQTESSTRRGETPNAARARLREVGKMAAGRLGELTERHIEGISAARPTETGYKLKIDVLELSRVPSTTDVLATYEVDVDHAGQITGYSRTYRYYRNQRSGE